MSENPLEAIHAASGAHLSPWFGANVPSRFGDPADEYRTLREGAGILDLGWYDVLELIGPDREEFLNGMVSNDVRDLAPDGGCHASVLTVQGKMVGDIVVLGAEESYLVLVSAGRAAQVAEHLERHLIADDVEVLDRSDGIGLIGLFGPTAADILAGSGKNAPSELWRHVAAPDGSRIVRINLAGVPSWGVLAPKQRLADLWMTFEAAGAKPVGNEALNIVRVESGLPWYGVDATEESFPLETRFDDTISTTKGCYLGQETIIRILHRGHVNRTMVGLVCDGDGVPEPGAEVVRDGKAVGRITSAVRSPALGKVVALAVLRTTHNQPGTRVIVPSGGESLDAVVAGLPFV